MSEDIVRVLRVLEYVGPRSRVEAAVAKSIHGTRHVGNMLVINAATLGAYPEILCAGCVKTPDEMPPTPPPKVYQLKAGECVRDGKLFGWTGTRCSLCFAHGQDNEGRACTDCGGTGELWGLMPNQPANLPPDTE